MKCIYCKSDCKYSERSDRKCPSCRRGFAFEPRSGDPITDTAFQAAIDAASSSGTVRFVESHVYYQVARRLPRKGTARTLFFVLGGASLAGAAVVPVAALAFAAFFGGLGVALWPKPTVKLSRAAFDTLWERWLEVHGAPRALIVRRQADPAAAPYRAHADIEHYSFDRVVVCDRASTVDVLLANNFHFENNCAVLSIDGYPPNAFEAVRAMLRNNPRLTVYVLHDATREGCTLAHQMASSPEWFRERARVVEVGIRPAHAKKFRGLWIPAAAGPAPSIRLLTRHERAWLASYALELAAIRPEQIIKRLYAAIASDAPLQSASEYIDISGGGDFYVDSASFSSEASTSDGGDDSFG